ncbi:MAG: hypothetical protein ISN29_10230 [Gammaproteobacteria bacterium AqS3]|nr:hypothetical protein [Gammaproteobacteria bacterium AqS3]
MISPRSWLASLVLLAALPVWGDAPGLERTIQRTSHYDFVISGLTPASVGNPERLEVAEGGSAASLGVKLNEAPTGSVTVTLAASTGGDITLDETTLSFDAGNYSVEQTVRVSAVDDADGDSERLMINLSAAGGGYGSVTKAVNVRINDDENQGLALSVTGGSVSIAEGGSTSFTVALAVPPTQNVSVSVAQSLPKNPDVSLSESALSFTPSDWSTVQSVTITAGQDDDAVDDSAVISLVCSGAGAYFYHCPGGSGFAVSITDDDTSRRGIQVSRSTVGDLIEGGTQTFTVRLGTQPTADVTLDLTLTPHAGNPGSTSVSVDTDPGSSGSQTTLAFTTTDWSTPKTVTLTGVQDSNSIDERFSLELRGRGGDYNGLSTTVSITVDDDNAQPDLIISGLTGGRLEITEGGGSNDAEFRVKLGKIPFSSQPFADAQVTVTLAASASGVIERYNTQLFFNESNYSKDQTVTVQAAFDSDLNNEDVQLTLSASGGGYDGVSKVVNIRVTDRADEQPRLTTPGLRAVKEIIEGESYPFRVRLEEAPTRNVIVKVIQNPPVNPQASFSKTTLTFTPGNWNVPQAVAVTTVRDDNYRPFGTVRVRLVCEGNNYYCNGGGLVIELIDIDEPRLLLSRKSVEDLVEGGTQSVTVRLNSRPRDGNVTFDVTLTPGSDYAGSTSATVDKSTLTFTPENWNTPQTLTLTAVQDDNQVGEYFRLALSDRGGSYLENSTTLGVSLIDDDALGLNISPGSYAELAEGESRRFTVSVLGDPAGAVSISLGSDNDRVATVTPARMTFTPGNASTPQSFTITAVQDPDSQNDRANISLSSSGGGFRGHSKTIEINVEDNDSGAGGESQQEIRLTQEVTAEVVRSVMTRSADVISLRFDSSIGTVDLTPTGASAEHQPRRTQADRHGRLGDLRPDRLGGIELRGGRPVSQSVRPGVRAPVSDFSYVLNQSETSASGLTSLWGRIDSAQFSGAVDDVDYDGSQSSLWLGVDGQLSSGLLIGGAVSQSSSSTEFTAGNLPVEIETDMTMWHSYMRAYLGGMEFRAMLGFGGGDLEWTRQNSAASEAEVSMEMYAFDLRWPLGRIGESTSVMASVGGVASQMSTDGAPGAAAVLSDLQPFAVNAVGGVELTREPLDWGGWRATPQTMLSLRQDGGDGVTGTGMEFSGSLRLRSPGGRMSVDFGARWLALHSEDSRQEQGGSIELRYLPRGPEGRGLSLLLGPEWGAQESDVLDRAQPFNAEANTTTEPVRAGLRAEAGYGLGLRSGLLRPYMRYRSLGSGATAQTHLSGGLQFSASRALEARLFLERRSAWGAPDRGRIAFDIHRHSF